MDVYLIRLSKLQLESLPDNERVAVIQFGHACNELSFLNKLLLVVSDTSATGIERSAMVAQSMIVIRLYAGKVYEAWRMLERDYFRSQLSRTLTPDLEPDGAQALEGIKRYFNKANLLSKIRNDYAFHYWSDHLKGAMSNFPGNWEFELILGDSHANSLHRYSEDFAVMGMLQATTESEMQAGMDRVVGELVEVGGDMIDFLSHALSAIFWKRLGTAWRDFEHTRHSVQPEQTLEDFKMPFFFTHKSDIKATNRELHGHSRTPTSHATRWPHA